MKRFSIFSVMLVAFSLSFVSALSFAKEKTEYLNPEIQEAVDKGDKETEREEEIERERRGPRADTEANPAIIGHYCPDCLAKLPGYRLHDNTNPPASAKPTESNSNPQKGRK